ncbi:MAG: monovalent cation/H+ antiporter subunit D [Comamonas sp. SCN 65-56]|uniref:monovalent cation/H+ antiporter subunit D n=1 Tax=Comamonas sp. SCN 65-56 TaxID=1660095 RepID=UPI00086DC7D2|nr:monovalent cation/H+ antiporter subunit D [Comamonas sp. SCN 65-56]ODS92205.1 MAG: monovalent cation/H+ antiporter subunit D [Comamonas sp. SCN 65-56]
MTDFIAALMPHLMLAPIALPLLTAAWLLFVREEHERLKLTVNIASTTVSLLVAIALLLWSGSGSTGSFGIYLPGNWPAPFGIVLVLDRLTALMLVTTNVVALASAVFAAARWHRAGVLYHSLFQFQLMGLCGAFLTADLFNLFVFFEIMLAASYGLLLHGSGQARVRAGLHYIAINLVASSLFLIGAAMLYGIAGTLNMADIARAVGQVAAHDRGLLHAAAAILAVAFFIKAAVWPLNFWLAPAYGAAVAPVGALFAVLTKVGIYSLLRLWTLWFGDAAGSSAYWGGSWLVGAGMATMVFGALGMLASQRLTQLASHAAILSSGTLLAALGLGDAAVTAGLLYYLPGSTLAVACLFLLADLVRRWRNDGATLAPYEREDTPFLTADLVPRERLNLDDDEQILVGRVIHATTALLGIAFLLTTLVIAGLPPLSGFIGKFAMLAGALRLPGSAVPNGVPTATWLLFGLMLLTGLAALLALVRVGVRHFWAAHDRRAPQLRVLEGLPIAGLLGACIALALYAGSAMRFTGEAAQALHTPAHYIHGVLAAQPHARTAP